MNRLASIFFIVLCIGLLQGCSTRNDSSTKTHFSGDLYFKLISIGSFYGADSLDVKRFNNYLDSLTTLNKDSLSRDDREVLNVYVGLRQNGLINKPYFNLRVDSVTGYIVYVDPVEFKKIMEFDKDDLINENMKVEIELTGDIINLGTLSVIDCTTIDKVEKVDGKTYWRK